MLREWGLEGKDGSVPAIPISLRFATIRPT